MFSLKRVLVKSIFFLTFENKIHIDKSITANTYTWEQTEYLVMYELDYLKERKKKCY